MKSIISVLLILFSLNLSAQEIQVMTYNIRLATESDGENAWSKRKEYLTDQVLFYAPDVMGVQEALPEQMEYLDENLTGYKHIGVGREGGNKGEFSAIFYNAEKLKVTDHGTFWLSTTPEEVSTGWDAALPRICTYGLFESKENGKRFYVFNTHFDHLGQEARKQSAQLILKKIKEINTRNLPAVLTGDFNLEPESEPIALIKTDFQDSHLAEDALVFGPVGTFNGFQHQKPVTRRIDYVFVSKNSGVDILKSAILSDSRDLKYPSDHLPVMAVLQW